MARPTKAAKAKKRPAKAVTKKGAFGSKQAPPFMSKKGGK